MECFDLPQDTFTDSKRRCSTRSPDSAQADSTIELIVTSPCEPQPKAKKSKFQLLVPLLAAANALEEKKPLASQVIKSFATVLLCHYTGLPRREEVEILMINLRRNLDFFF